MAARLRTLMLSHCLNLLNSKRRISKCPKASNQLKVHLLPKGRVINHSLFVKDQFNDKATPSYKIELAFEPKALDKFYEELLDFAVEKWGKGGLTIKTAA